MLIFLDTETTGLDKNAHLCQVAYKTKDEIVCEYFKPPCPITLDAMSINHITNKMVKDKPPFLESKTYFKLKKLFENDNNILVAHNANFDVQILNNDGLYPHNYICTKKICQSADKNNEIPKYNLQYLRYYFGIELDEEIIAHDALGDILILEQVFLNIYNKFYKNADKSKEQILFEMQKISTLPLLLKRITFGKYKNKSFEYIAENNLGYLKWLNNQPNLSEDLKYTLNYYINSTNNY